MRYPSTYRRPCIKNVTPILGTLRKKVEETREVPDPYPVAYDIAHKY